MTLTMNWLSSICVLAFVLCLTPVSGQNYNYDYYNAYDGGNGAAKEPQHIMCYVCHYHRIDKENNQGDPRCDDPFQAPGIAAVPCEGACGKTLTHHGGGEYMVVRSCLQNCRDTTDPGKSIRCCHDAYCNGARSTSASRLHVSLFVLTTAGLARWLL